MIDKRKNRFVQVLTIRVDSEGLTFRMEFGFSKAGGGSTQT